jgi:hypothetical protein
MALTTEIMTADAAMIERACEAAWKENAVIYAETHPEDERPLSEGWDKEPEALRQTWRRMMRAAFDAVDARTKITSD